MSDILIKAASYLMMIAVAYLFKKMGYFRTEHGKALSVICMKFTLPCAIISSFASFGIDISLFVMIALGLLGNVLLVSIGFMITRGKSKDERIYYAANIGYNIGNFTLPFTSSFSGPSGVIATSLFDAGNAIMLLGINYPLLDASINKKKGKAFFKNLWTKLFSSIAFDAYFVMIILSLLSISLPKSAVMIATEIGRANGPIAMFMIGMLLEIRFDKRYIKSASRLLIIRAGVAALLSLIIYNLDFIPYEAAKAGIMAACSPIGSVSPAYVALLDGDVELASFVNTVSILISLIVIPVLAIVL